MRSIATAVLAAALGLAATCAAAMADGPFGQLVADATAPAPRPFFVRAGGSAVLVQSASAVSLAGHGVPGAGVHIDDVGAFYAEAGYNLSEAFSVSLSGGYPPTLGVAGAGRLAPFGTLFRETVGIPVLAVAYHPGGLGPLRPYVGVGVGYAITFADHAGAVRDPDLRGKAVLALVGGLDYALDAHWGVFVDVKKVFLKQGFHGLAPAVPGTPATIPASATIRTDPVIVSAGLSYAF